LFVCDYMKKSLLTVNKETPISTALEILQKHQIRQLPVVEGEFCF
jgi:CBS domain-containing protein